MFSSSEDSVSDALITIADLWVVDKRRFQGGMLLSSKLDEELPLLMKLPL